MTNFVFLYEFSEYETLPAFSLVVNVEAEVPDGATYSTEHHRIKGLLATLPRQEIIEFFGEEFEDSWSPAGTPDPIEVALAAAGYTNVRVLDNPTVIN